VSTSFAVGFGFDPTDVEGFTRLARTADAGGLEMVSTGDTPALLGDLYVGLTLIAQNTSRCRVGTFMTNPLTRHPVVAASAIASVDAISGGRAVLGISSGDSGVLNLGLQPARIGELEEYIRALRDLWSRGEATFQGREARLTWARRPIPLYLGPGGPAGLRLAGRLADGVFIETGVLPEIVDHALSQLEAGAREAGRRLEDIDVWFHLRGCFGSSPADATRQIRSALAGMANRVLRFTDRGKFVPDEIRPRLEELVARYQIVHHEEHGKVLHNAPLVDELGLGEYLAERFAVVGTPEEWIRRIGSLRRMGVEKLAFACMMEDRQAFVETLVRDVMPAVGAVSGGRVS
jgi:5,10-methylenetetrahydromethanopterin reductase